MVFNSLAFLVFAAAFFPLYFGTRGRTRTWVCLLASYVFYGWWDWRFLSLIIFSTVMDWWFGLWISYLDTRKETRAEWGNGSLTLKIFGKLTENAAKTGWNRKTVLIFSMAMNLGFLGVFKYFNFFVENLTALISSFGLRPSLTTLHIILPVGISFYTFQSMSYTIDVYRRQIAWEPSLLKFATFIALFPQLVAGPIVRAADLLPQMGVDKKFSWTQLHSGWVAFFVGFFKSGDCRFALAPLWIRYLQRPKPSASMHLLIGVIFYSFQIYCDFSGYSDIAIGSARIMGYHFPENFRTPYFSKSFSEFWSRWHVAFLRLRDYLYIPLGGNRHAAFHTYKNNLLTMLLGGLWHGANWAFIFWGFLHGLYLIAQRLISPAWRRLLHILRVPKIAGDALEMTTVYALTLVAWVFFRSGSIGLAGGDSFTAAGKVLSGIGSLEGFSFGAVINKFQVIKGFLLIGILLVAELANNRFQWNLLQVRRPVWRLLAFAVLLWLIALFGTFGANAFIYFQF